MNFNLKDYSTKADVLEAVDRVRYLGESTNMTGGLKLARIQVFGDDYDQRKNADRIIVLITDGVPTIDADTLDAEVAAIRGMGIRIIGLGITDKVLHVLISTLMSYFGDILIQSDLLLTNRNQRMLRTIHTSRC